MKNSVKHLTPSEMKIVMDSLVVAENIHIVSVESEKLNSLEDYFSLISALFEFPTKCHNFSSYLDWIKDLSWLNKKQYVLVFYNYKKSFKGDVALQESILEDFSDDILPWWQSGVIEFSTDGTPTGFDVYIVE